jgi:hypothetical protein
MAAAVGGGAGPARLIIEMLMTAPQSRCLKLSKPNLVIFFKQCENRSV